MQNPLDVGDLSVLAPRLDLAELGDGVDGAPPSSPAVGPRGPPGPVSPVAPLAAPATSAPDLALGQQTTDLFASIVWNKPTCNKIIRP